MTLFWLFGAFVGTLGSALFSGMETGSYTLNRIRLHLRVHGKQRTATVLDKMLNAPNRMLGTLLVGNNIVNYLASYSIAQLLAIAGYSDWGMVLVNVLLLTPLLLRFTAAQCAYQQCGSNCLVNVRSGLLNSWQTERRRHQRNTSRLCQYVPNHRLVPLPRKYLFTAARQY